MVAGSDTCPTSQRGICSCQASCTILVELRTGNTERILRGGSRRAIARDPVPGVGDTGITMALTSIPLANNACKGGREKLPCIPKKRTRGARFNLTAALASCSISIIRQCNLYSGELIMPRMVQCVKLGRELPGLDKPPFPGELGQRIYEHVSKQAYDMWPAQSTLIINH